MSGLPTHLALVADYVETEGIELLFVSETQCRDRVFWNNVRLSMGWRLVGVSRHVEVREDGSAPLAVGGVAIINCAPSRLAITKIDSDPLGFVAVEVRERDGDPRPFAAFSVYVPPRGSPAEPTAEALYVRLTDRVRAALGVYGENAVVVGGDFNARLGPGKVGGGAHFSRDPHRVNDARLRAFCDSLRLSPTAGREDGSPAHTTSRSINGRDGRSEVDFILARVGASNWEVRGPAFRWEELPGSCTHRPLTAHFTPPPRAGSDSRARQRVGGAQPQSAPPAYSHPAWEDVARALERELSGLDARRSSEGGAPGPPGGANTERLANDLRDALLRAATSLPQQGANGTREGGAARVARARGVKQLRFPPWVVDALERARDARRRARTADAPGEALDSLRRLQLEARHAVRAARRTWREELIRKLHSLRASDPKGFFRLVDREAPDKAGVWDDGDDGRDVPHEEGQPPPMERLLRKLEESMGAPRPPPPAVREGGERWMRLLPQLPPQVSSGLGRHFTPEEVHNVVMPVRRDHGHVPCPASGAVDPECALCVDYNGVRNAHGGRGDIVNPAPRHSPTINAAAGSGDSLKGAHLRFPRFEDDPARTRMLRWRLCAALTRLYNACLDTGGLPPDMLRSLAVSIPKGSGGARVNYASPDSRRFVVMGGLLAKGLELLLAARFTHWALRHRVVVPGTQGAFLPLANTTAHVFALWETLRLRARRGLVTYVLFCDIIEAYPSVGVDTLAAKLRHMGVPERLVEFLRQWGLNRTVVLQVNGERSEPKPMAKGLGIGACNSPVMWNIFVSSLGAYLATFDAGVKVGQGEEAFTLNIFLFADDAASPVDTHEKLQLVAERVDEWCDAWGIRLKLGPNKTAFLRVLPPRAARPAAPAPAIIISSGEVPQVGAYKYLGAPLVESLSQDGLVDKAVERLKGLLARYFEHNSALSGLDAVSTGQLFKVLCVGSIGYLLSAIPLTVGNLEALDVVLRSAARRILRLPSSAPKEVVLAMAGLPSALYLLTAARAGLWLYLTNTPYTGSPAVKVFQATVGDPPPADYRRGSDHSWAACTKAFFEHWAREGVPWPGTPSRSLAAAAAAAYARRVCALQARLACPPQAGPGIVLARRQPADPTPALAVAALHLGYHYPLGLLMDCTRPTPMSFTGVGGSGAALALTTGRVPACGTPGLAALRLGAVALRRPPWAPSQWAIPQKASPEAFGEAARGRACPLCGSHLPATPFHVLRECEHEEVAKARREVDGEARTLLAALADSIQRAARPFNHAYAVSDAARAAQGALSKDALLSDFVMFHLLLAVPWHAGCADASASVELAFGRLFDAAVVPNQAIHGVYNLWVPWAARRVTRVIGVWSREVQAKAGQ